MATLLERCPDELVYLSEKNVAQPRSPLWRKLLQQIGKASQFSALYGDSQPLIRRVKLVPEPAPKIPLEKLF